MCRKSSAPATRDAAAAPAVKPPAEQVVRDIRCRTRKQNSAEEKIRACWRACAARRASRSCVGARYRR